MKIERRVSPWRATQVSLTGNPEFPEQGEGREEENA